MVWKWGEKSPYSINITLSKADLKGCMARTSVLGRWRQKDQDTFVHHWGHYALGQEKYGGSATDFPSPKEVPVCLFFFSGEGGREANALSLE